MKLLDRILRYMKGRYQLYTAPWHFNIVYVEGMNPDGTLNDNTPDQYNDLRCIFDLGELDAQGNPYFKTWIATTEPGRRYTEQPINSGGAARIAFGQFMAWQVGMHRGHHEALVQTGGPVVVHRDYNQDFQRVGDRTDKGFFGINQHAGANNPRSIGGHSAGCLVTPFMSDQADFMRLVKLDVRYRENKKFIFTTTIIDGKDI
jgi:hypothetical protein